MNGFFKFIPLKKKLSKVSRKKKERDVPKINFFFKASRKKKKYNNNNLNNLGKKWCEK
jgi:hypothetical protein